MSTMTVTMYLYKKLYRSWTQGTWRCHVCSYPAKKVPVLLPATIHCPNPTDKRFFKLITISSGILVYHLLREFRPQVSSKEYNHCSSCSARYTCLFLIYYKKFNNRGTMMAHANGSCRHSEWQRQPEHHRWWSYHDNSYFKLYITSGITVEFEELSPWRLGHL